MFREAADLLTVVLLRTVKVSSDSAPDGHHAAVHCHRMGDVIERRQALGFNKLDSPCLCTCVHAQTWRKVLCFLGSIGVRARASVMMTDEIKVFEELPGISRLSGEPGNERMHRCPFRIRPKSSLVYKFPTPEHL